MNCCNTVQDLRAVSVHPDRMSDQTYIHGYDACESERLLAQASSVLDLLHGDTSYPSGSRVLEVGCGTGAQTVTLARNSPGAQFVSFDRNLHSLEQARERLQASEVTNVELRQEELYTLPFERRSFDHVFVCFVLEHLAEPVRALRVLRDLLKPGGTITVFEGDHGSAYFHPDSEIAHRAVACQVELQRRAGGNACIGRELYPLLVAAEYRSARVWPRMVYVDASRPALIDSFTRHTFTGMIEAVRQRALDAGIIDADSFDTGIRDLYRTAANDGVFCYTFFKGVATA
jgi:SAM-dependent methyltransferase